MYSDEIGVKPMIPWVLEVFSRLTMPAVETAKKPSGIQGKRMTISLNSHLEQQYIQLRTPTMTFTVLVLAVCRTPVT